MGIVSEKFSVVIPLKVRRAIGLKPGMRVRVIADGKGARIETDARHDSPESLATCAGKYRVTGHVSISDMNLGSAD